MAAKKYVQGQTLYLAGSGVLVGATSIVLTSLTDIYGNAITSITSFGDKGYITLEPDTSNEEAATFTSVTVNANGTVTLGGVSTVLAQDPYTETSGLVRAHSGGTKVVITDNVAFWNTFTNKNNDEIVTGQWTFNNTPIVPGTVSNASTTVKGVGKVSVAPADPNNPIFVGQNDTAAFQVYVPAGVMFPYAAASAPTGFLLCDGSAVNRTTYAALFAVVGTSYGAGDGSTTFNLPDTRGRTMIGAGTGTKVATFASRSSDTITVTGLTNANNNEFQTGQAITYHTTSGVITGLTNDTVYYIIRVTSTSFKLASSLANAQNGTQIVLSSDGSGTQTFTLTLTSRSVGNTGGEENHAMSLTELLAHTHNEQNNTAGGSSNQISLSGTFSTTPASINIPTSSTGGNAAMNIMQPFFTGSWIIKT